VSDLLIKLTCSLAVLVRGWNPA